MATDKKSKSSPDDEALDRAYGQALQSGDIEEVERLNVVTRERRSRVRVVKSRD